MTYPAAHSMDTTWFCVDGDGHVAVLESYEAGAVPEAWQGGQDGGITLVEQLERSAVPADPTALAADHGDEVVAIAGPAASAPRDGDVYDVLVSAAHPRVRDLFPGARGLAAATGTWLWVRGPVPVARVVALCRHGLVHRAWAYAGLRPSWFGLYGYHHDPRYENTRSGPYVRDGRVPAAPIRAEDLPERLREVAVHLPGVSFARDGRLQPVEHVPCRSHQQWWVDLDGNLRGFDEDPPERR